MYTAFSELESAKQVFSQPGRHMTQPLRELLAKENVWASSDAQKSFESTKRALRVTHVRSESRNHANASRHGLGAALIQKLLTLVISNLWHLYQAPWLLQQHNMPRLRMRHWPSHGIGRTKPGKTSTYTCRCCYMYSVCAYIVKCVPEWVVARSSPRTVCLHLSELFKFLFG